MSKTKASILNIGDEILIGQTLNTNSQYISKQLILLGIDVLEQRVCKDLEEEIIKNLNDLCNTSDCVLITGGLGPTNDDVTEVALKNFISRNKVITPLTPIENTCGTASGFYFEIENLNHTKTLVFSMPGVPREMQSMIENFVLDKIKEKLKIQKTIFIRNYHTAGIGESKLYDEIKKINLDDGVKLGWLPHPGSVTLRVQIELKQNSNDVSKKFLEIEKKILPVLEPYLYAITHDNEKISLEEKIVLDLIEKEKTVSTAESCTGGLIANLITNVPNSSKVFIGSIVAYSNEVKKNKLNVSDEVLKTKGAVSREVVEIMARQALKEFNTDFALSVSGIAGPSGGTKDKPVGTVWVALAHRDGKIESQNFLHGTDRINNKFKSAYAALMMLYKALKSYK
jgi:nicotinamide-nucleotide amidase